MNKKEEYTMIIIGKGDKLHLSKQTLMPIRGLCGAEPGEYRRVVPVGRRSVTELLDTTGGICQNCLRRLRKEAVPA